MEFIDQLNSEECDLFLLELSKEALRQYKSNRNKVGDMCINIEKQFTHILKD